MPHVQSIANGRAGTNGANARKTATGASRIATDPRRRRQCLGAKHVKAQLTRRWFAMRMDVLWTANLMSGLNGVSARRAVAPGTGQQVGH